MSHILSPGKYLLGLLKRLRFNRHVLHTFFKMQVLQDIDIYIYILKHKNYKRHLEKEVWRLTLCNNSLNK